eukprot:m.159288 g.159288  ORF g.159288 m.159288 type:complete len:52 (-) comp14526_c0_seq8:681-836(-)
MDHTASVGHNRFVKLMISVTAIVMAFVLLLEWMDLPYVGSRPNIVTQVFSH